MGSKREIEIRARTGIGARKDPRAARRNKRQEMVKMLAGKGDEGTPEQQNHGAFVDRYTHVGDRHAVVKQRQEPLDRYKARKQIPFKLWQAGDRLRKLNEARHVGQRVTANYDPDNIRGTRTASVPLKAIEAQKAFVGAMQAVGITLSPVLVMVVLDGRDAKAYGRRAKTSDPVAVLRLALTELAYHFRLLEPPAELRVDYATALGRELNKLADPDAA